MSAEDHNEPALRNSTEVESNEEMKFEIDSLFKSLTDRKLE